MYLVVGLGNPGKEYENNRHNIGFKVIDKFSEMYKIDVEREKFKGVCGDTRIKGEKVILLKPLTYMNNSGESVIECADYFDIPDENIIIVYDDISLDVGRLRIRRKGSAGGQNGVKSIIHHLDTQEFPRVKVGVGKPERDLVSHVIGDFSKEDAMVMEKVTEVAVKAVVKIIEDGVGDSMNIYNGYDAKEV